MHLLVTLSILTSLNALVTSQHESVGGSRNYKTSGWFFKNFCDQPTCRDGGQHGTSASVLMPSVLWHCWLGDRKGIRPVKKLSGGVLVWLSVVFLELGADLIIAQLIPLPLSVYCFSRIQIGFTLLIPAHPDSPGIRSIKWVCVCV